jgi:hypothetical protein
MAVLETNANPNMVIAEMLRMLRRFIVFLPEEKLSRRVERGRLTCWNVKVPETEKIVP